jgi:hypothetical protein
VDVPAGQLTHSPSVSSWYVLITHANSNQETARWQGVNIRGLYQHMKVKLRLTGAKGGARLAVRARRAGCPQGSCGACEWIGTTPRWATRLAADLHM